MKMKSVDIKNDLVKSDPSPYVLPSAGLVNIESINVKVLVNRNVMPGMDEYSVWVPDVKGLYKTVEKSIFTGEGSYGLLASFRIPDHFQEAAFGDNRDRLLKGWYAKLYTACYLEIFKQHPHLYPALMKCMNITTYPNLWSSQFDTLMNESILGKLENEHMYFGYLKLPAKEYVYEK